MISDATIQVIVVAICTATPPTLVAWAALRRTGRIETKAVAIEAKTTVIEQKADIATTKAESAAISAELSAKGTDTAVRQIGEVHDSVKQIDKQTNGHLSHLTTMIDTQNKMIGTLLGILQPTAGRTPRPGQETRQDQPSRDKLDAVAAAALTIAETNAAIASATAEVVETLKRIHDDQIPGKTRP